MKVKFLIKWKGKSEIRSFTVPDNTEQKIIDFRIRMETLYWFLEHNGVEYGRID